MFKFQKPAGSVVTKKSHPFLEQVFKFPVAVTHYAMTPCLVVSGMSPTPSSVSKKWLFPPALSTVLN